MPAAKKVLLMILDGWGIGRGDKADVVSHVSNGHLAALTQRYPHATLRTDGENVGLPNGQMGNSEVGHMNIGAGRVLYQDLVKINRAVAQNTLGSLPAVQALLAIAKKPSATLHLLGLFSDGGVHSHIAHLYAFGRLAKENGIERVAVHAFMDGRDTDPKSGLSFIDAFRAEQATGKMAGELVSMIGRYWAMDRDKRWERVKRAYDLLVHGVGEATTDFRHSLETLYEKGITDEFVEPYALSADVPMHKTIQSGDTVLFLNFRNDRAKELTTALTQASQEGMTPIENLAFFTMTPYDPTYQGLTVLFPKENVSNTLGEVLASEGLKQLRIAETEKYPHVTFFFNGGREALFENEDHIMVPSPKVATYDLQPEMSAPEVTEKVVNALNSEAYDFICLNFANGDMVGHTGVYEAIDKAVHCIDKCAAEVIVAAQAHGYEVIQIADHGNADHALNEDGTPNTAHSLNPVPLLVISDRVASVKSGVLADVAPTILTLMGVPVPPDMTGNVLVTMKA